LIIEDIKINAASQNTGIDIINPIILSVRGILLNPKNDINEPTIFFAEPVSCKNFPKIVPTIIIGPTLIMILLNPSNNIIILFKNEILRIKPEINPADNNAI
jgi:hypothetical protein